MKHAAFLSALLCASAIPFPVAFASNTSVTGIELGSSYEEAYNHLLASGFTISKIVRFTSDELKTTFLTKRDDPRDQYAIQGLNGKVYMIDHVVTFAQGSQPNIEDTIDNLTRKYGTSPSQLEPNVMGRAGWYDLAWVYDEHGAVRPLAGPQSIACTTFSLLSNDLVTVMPTNEVLHSKCAKYVTAFILGNSSTHSIMVLHVCAVDVKPLREFTEELANQQQEMRNKQIEQTKRNKAPL